MRLVLAALSGFTLTLSIFAGGVVTAVAYLSADRIERQAPAADTTALWTNEAVRVDTRQQDFERVDNVAIATSQEEPDPQPAPASAESLIWVDPVTTASFEYDEAFDPAQYEEEQAAFSEAHYAWCSRRYRSYDPTDNSYNPYRGGRRECVSPFQDDIVAATPAERQVASADGSIGFYGEPQADETTTRRLSAEHIRRCFARYRSYRAEDNSYQPYGGGPRRQCQ
jgi:hypothetical protein